MWNKKYNFNDPLSLHGRYSNSQRNVIGVGAMLAGSAISAGGSIAGGLMAKGPSSKKVSTFSKSQKIVDQLISDFMLGITRDAKGRELSRDPIFQRMLADGKGLPPAFVRPHSAEQNQIFDIAEGMIPKASNLKRPDLDFVTDKRQELLGAAMGGNFDEAVVVGEDGPEIVLPDGSGGVTVIPNPDSLANPERAMAASREATAKTGLPGKSLGDLPFRRQFTGDDDNSIIFNPENYLAGRNFGFDENDATGTGLNSLFNKYLDDNYLDATYDVEENGRRGPETNQVNALKRIRGDDPLGFGDGFTRNKAGNKYKKPKQAQFLIDAQNDFLNSDIFSDATSNPAVDDIFARIGEGNLSGFGDFLGNNREFGFNQPGTANEFGRRNGTLQFNNPFDLDTGNLGAAADAYLAGIPASAGGSGEEPAVSIPGIDIGTATTGFSDRFIDEYDLTNAGDLTGLNSELSDFYNSDTGKLFANSGVNIGIGLDGLTVSDGVTEAQFGQFLDSFDAFKNADDGDSDTPAEDPTSDIFETLAPTISGLVGDSFDSSASGSEFDAGVGDQARANLQDTTLPSIREGFAGGNLFGSGRQKAEQQAVTDLDDTLVAAKNQFVSGRKESFENRRSTYINQAMELMKLPTEIANMKATGRAIEATITNIFADIEIGKAAMEANLTNQDLTNLTTIWSLLEQKNIKFEQQDLVAIKNAFTNEDGFSLSDILTMMNNKLNANETAIITEGG